ncbi:hypothetical protein HYPSUDRAFT_42622 [Hypholoma sublateritium FD-334 SS-4]|uniref:Uncharacterized protein n=1 Tax=Hypholoma sublateritium (strain FD-334 SS-4) TaxID=945553 RepID=A0A0D2NPX8_HYPSF|nr:hypothetical protein HYPSUDRAFT_42622 [Hypholoma sublateritium FD-334 SS-4]
MVWRFANGITTSRAEKATSRAENTRVSLTQVPENSHGGNHNLNSNNINSIIDNNVAITIT